MCSHTHNGILLSHKKERSLAIFDNMDGLGGHYASEKKSDREDKCCVFTYIWNLQNKTKYNKTKIDSQICRTSLWLPEGEEMGNAQNRRRKEVPNYQL